MIKLSREECDRACLRTFVLYFGVLCYLFLQSAWWALLAVLLAEAFHSLWVSTAVRGAALWVDIAISVVASFAAVFVFVATAYVFNASVVIGYNDERILLFAFFFAILIAARTLMLMLPRVPAAIVAGVAVILAAGFVAATLTNQGFYAEGHTVAIAFTYCAVVLVTVTLPALGIGLFSYLIGAVVAIVVLAASHSLHSPRPFSYYVNH